MSRSRMLFISAQAQWPARDGGARRSWELFKHIAPRFTVASCIARESVLDWPAVEPAAYPGWKRWRDNRTFAALVSWLTRGDFLWVRHVSDSLRYALRRRWQESVPDVTVCSFLYATPLLRGLQGETRLLVDTHNDDWGWYGALRRSSRNPIARGVCNLALHHSSRNLAALPTGTLMVHVSRQDLEAYRAKRPDLEHLVVENGTNPRPRRREPAYALGMKYRLMFVGSLANTMNRDALELFAKRFWPALAEVAEMRVVGSSPSPAVKTLCEANGWELHANVTDTELDVHYENIHFSVMPFGYGEGSKLKLLEACGRGVPVLTTNAGRVGFDELPEWIRVDDSPDKWRASLNEAYRFTTEAGAELYRFSGYFSWDRLAERLYSAAMRLKPVSPAGFGIKLKQ